MFSLFSLNGWWQALTTAQHVYWIIAIVFTLLFIALYGLSLLGIDSDSAADTDLNVDLDHEVSHDFSVDKEFSAFSIRSIIAFFTFFGWTGVYFLSSGYRLPLATGLSFLAGGAAMVVVAYMIFKFAQMEKSGTVNVLDALENTGEVYLSIPPELEGRGKIHIVVDGALHEFEAETKGQMLPTGSQVKVIDILEDQVLLVEGSQPASTP